MAAYLGYTLRMKTLFCGCPVMAHDTHTRRRRRPNVKQYYVAPLPVTYKPKVKPQLTLSGQQSVDKLQLITIKMADDCYSLLFKGLKSFTISYRVTQLHTIKLCSVVFGVTLRVLVINTSSPSSVNNKRRHLLPATSVTNLLWCRPTWDANTPNLTK